MRDAERVRGLLHHARQLPEPGVGHAYGRGADVDVYGSAGAAVDGAGLLTGEPLREMGM